MNQIQNQKELLLKSQWSEVLESLIPYVFVVLNRNRDIVHLSDRFTELGLNRELDQIPGMRIGEAFSCRNQIEEKHSCGDTNACRLCGIRKTVRESLKGVSSVDECRILTRDNEALDLRIWSRPVNIEGESFIFVFLQDISSEKRREILERFFFHDVLNTAGNLRNTAYLLQQGKLTNREDMEQSLYRLSRQLINEINEFRDLTLAENNELQVKLEPIKTSSFLLEVLEYYRQQKYANAIVLDAEHSREIEITTDPTLLYRVIGNLVKNALEASWRGETVTAGVREKETEIEIWVHSENPIEHDIQLQIFQRSFSTKGLGRGLGTYSVKLLTERYLGGRVDFTSSADSGTVFSIHLPLHGPQ